jgi:tRNA (mo5U34)-methyltransferase
MRGIVRRDEEPALTPEVLQAEIAKIPFWYHRIDLGDGIVTPGRADTEWGHTGDTIGMPASLSGKTVLDIGAWDGFYSFEAERRGAKRVLATDHFAWTTYEAKAGFALARRALRSNVEDMNVDVMDLSPERVGVYDVVLFLGVLYHMRHPMLALEKVAAVTGEQLIVETHVDLLDVTRPAMAFYPGTELSGDATNWCGPNPAMVLAMLQVAGFPKAVVHAGPFELPGTTRMMFHAWK